MLLCLRPELWLDHRSRPFRCNILMLNLSQHLRCPKDGEIQPLTNNEGFILFIYDSVSVSPTEFRGKPKLFLPFSFPLVFSLRWRGILLLMTLWTVSVAFICVGRCKKESCCRPSLFAQVARLNYLEMDSKFLLESLKKINHLGNLNVDGRAIWLLRWIIRTNNMKELTVLI
jgi:hypothetical protein